MKRACPRAAGHCLGQGGEGQPSGGQSGSHAGVQAVEEKTQPNPGRRDLIGGDSCKQGTNDHSKESLDWRGFLQAGAGTIAVRRAV